MGWACKGSVGGRSAAAKTRLVLAKERTGAEQAQGVVVARREDEAGELVSEKG